MQIAKGNRTIQTLEEWFLHAPPEKGEKQWVDGRSAKEMARSWLGGESRQRLLNLLRPISGSVTLESAEPECSVPFDEFSGPRQCDLAIQASSDRGGIVIHIEGKADEPFGALTGEAYDAATAANALRMGRRKSAVPRRIEGLSERLFGRNLDDAVRGLRYQLLYSAAAVLADAAERKSIAAVFVVQELHSPNLDSRKLRRNVKDWEAFLRMFSEIDEQHLKLLETLIGPGTSLRTPRTDVPLYFARMVTTIAAAVP
ncbi:MAG: DUF6946 family protein [Janthinobacterium lividum]